MRHFDYTDGGASYIWWETVPLRLSDPFMIIDPKGFCWVQISEHRPLLFSLPDGSTFSLRPWRKQP